MSLKVRKYVAILGVIRGDVKHMFRTFNWWWGGAYDITKGSRSMH